MPTRLTYLFDQYMHRRLSAAEQEELAAALRDDAAEDAFKDLISDQFTAGEIPYYPMNENAAQDMLQAILQTPLPDQRPARVTGFRRWYAAAAVLLLVAAGGYVIWQTNRPSSGIFPTTAQDIAPGRNGAILTLDDGTELVLDSLGNGQIARQQGAHLMLNNGNLSYTPEENTKATIAYNTITVPKGRQFRITLPDGSAVWLNAASSIRYPVQFSKRERTVTLSGEAYFEIAQHSDAPFLVQLRNGASVAVLGTSFNIHAYENEPAINTTLLSGAVKIRTRSQEAVLQPGQQAGISDQIHVSDGADLQKAVAWKNGYFDFNGMDLAYAMRQIARWYEVEIVYTGNIPDVHLYGRISRDISLAGLIRGLNSTLNGVDMSIRDGKLIIQPVK